MFDIGFAELLLIAIVGLLVLGPERLPIAIRTVSLWVGRLRRSFGEIRAEIEREVGADEIRRQLHNESVMASLKDSKNKIDQSIKEAGEQFNDIGSQITQPAPPPEANKSLDIAADSDPMPTSVKDHKQ
ncbi:MAG: sec-independent protein translocase protein TatB [Zhongshania sp.]|jgi:sec-independent protein translocase protein TatB